MAWPGVGAGSRGRTAAGWGPTWREDLVWAIWKAGAAEGTGRWCAEERVVLLRLFRWTSGQIKAIVKEAPMGQEWILSREVRVSDGAVVLRIRTPARDQLDKALSRPSTAEDVRRQHAASRRGQQLYRTKRPWWPVNRESWYETESEPDEASAASERGVEEDEAPAASEHGVEEDACQDSADYEEC